MKSLIFVLLIICGSECFGVIPPKYERDIRRWNWVPAPAPLPNPRPNIIVIPVPVPASSIFPFSVPLPLKENFNWIWWKINGIQSWGKNKPAPA